MNKQQTAQNQTTGKGDYVYILQPWADTELPDDGNFLYGTVCEVIARAPYGFLYVRLAGSERMHPIDRVRLVERAERIGETLRLETFPMGASAFDLAA